MKIGESILNIVETDGSPSVWPFKLSVPNTSLTDNGDGTAALDFAKGAAINSNDTEVIFNDGGTLTGDAGFTYDKATDIATLDGALDVPEIFNSLGDLKIMPDAQGDVTHFEDTDVGDAEDGKHAKWFRKSAEGDSFWDLFITADGHGTIAFTPFNGSRRFQFESNVPIHFHRNATSDVYFFANSGSGENRSIFQSGYITADSTRKFINWKVDDTDDYFHLSREDTNILGFKVDMPLRTVNTNDDDYVEIFHDLSNGHLNVGSGALFLNANGRFIFQSSATEFFRFAGRTDINQTTFATADAGGNQIIITSLTNNVKEHEHPTTTDPTLFIHSDINPETDATQWLSLWHDQVDGNISLGKGDLLISTPANKTIELQTVVWDDANIGAGTLSGPPGLQPGIVNFVDNLGADTGIATFGIAVGEGLSGLLEIQHDYKEGTDIIFHVHWQGIAAPTETDNVQWQLTYTLCDEDVAETLPPVTIISTETAFDTQYNCPRSDFAAIDGTNIKIGDQFLFTIQRIAASADEYGGEALIQTVGIHYQINTMGSRQITTK